MEARSSRASGGARNDRSTVSVRGRLPSCAGMTLLELMVAFSYIFLCAVGFLKVIAFATTTTGAQREMSLASEAARQMVEVLQAEDFADVFARYNDDPSDDPGGTGTAPGSSIAVPELAAAPGNVAVGRITFPSRVNQVGGVELREDVTDTVLGMPRDLNGDGTVDSEDHADDYALLPVRIEFEWVGQGGQASLEIKTLLADY